MFKPTEGRDKLEINSEILDNLKDDLLSIMASNINRQMLEDVIPGLSQSNFTDEALAFMKDHSMDTTDHEMVRLYSKQALAECREATSFAIISEDTLTVAKTAIDTEYGTLSMPILKPLTRAAELLFTERT